MTAKLVHRPRVEALEWRPTALEARERLGVGVADLGLSVEHARELACACDHLPQ